MTSAVSRKPDAAEIELMQATAGWKHFERKIRQEIERERDSLETQEDHRTVCAIQGRIKSLRLVLDLPSIIISESRDEEISKR